MTTNPTTIHGGDREAVPGELCSCGAQALVIFETAKFGDVGYCGIPHGGRMAGSDDAVTERPSSFGAADDEDTFFDDEDDRCGEVVIVPAVTVPADYVADVKAATAALDEVMPKLYEAFDLVGKVLPLHWRVWDADHLDALPSPSSLRDGLREAFDDMTGWGDLDDVLCDLRGLSGVYTDAEYEPFQSHEDYPGWYKAFRGEQLRYRLARLDELADQVPDHPETGDRLLMLAELSGMGDQDADEALRALVGAKASEGAQA